MPDRSAITLRALAAATASGVTSGFAVPVNSTDVAVLLNVTAVGGTSPTLTLSLEWSHDGATWAAAETADAFNQVTAVGAVVKQFTVKGDLLRVRSTVGGVTPSFTFSVTAYGV